MPCRTAHSVDPQHGKEEDERNGTRRGKRSFLLQNTPMHNYRPTALLVNDAIYTALFHHKVVAKNGIEIGLS